MQQTPPKFSEGERIKYQFLKSGKSYFGTIERYHGYEQKIYSVKPDGDAFNRFIYESEMEKVSEG